MIFGIFEQRFSEVSFIFPSADSFRLSDRDSIPAQSQENLGSRERSMVKRVGGAEIAGLWAPVPTWSWQITSLTCSSHVLSRKCSIAFTVSACWTRRESVELLALAEATLELSTTMALCHCW